MGLTRDSQYHSLLGLSATGGQSNTAVQAFSLVRLEWQTEVCFSSYHRADWGRLALAWPVITLITQENDNNAGSLMTGVIVVEAPCYAAVGWWMTSTMHRAVRRSPLHGCYLNPFVIVATFLRGYLAQWCDMIAEGEEGGKVFLNEKKFSLMKTQEVTCLGLFPFC